MRIRHPKILYILICTVLMFVGVEVLLRVFDPLGMARHYDWLNWHYSHQEPDPIGYTYPTGAYKVNRDDLTINEQGNRITPQAIDPSCTVAIIGDSVSFGQGVADDEAFPYILGESNPNLQFINTAKSGYNSDNLLLSAQSVEADLYIYLIVHNDIGLPIYASEQLNRPAMAISKYIIMSRLQAQEALTDVENYRTVLQALPENMLYFAFEPDSTAATVAGEYVSVNPIPETPRISPSDQHPNPAGHQIIADTIQTVLDDTTCDRVNESE